jgi:signal transduction histidine kinase
LDYYVEGEAMKKSVRETRGSVAWGQRLLRYCVLGVVLLVLVILSLNYPAGLRPWRFFASAVSLTILAAMNLGGRQRPAARLLRTARPRLHAALDWSSLSVSAALVLFAVWASWQLDIAYLLSIICIQTDFKRGVRPAGAVFSAIVFAVWLVFLAALGQPVWAIVARGSALAVGIVLGGVMAWLLKRSIEQTERAESLLRDLQAAHNQLESAHEAEKDLAVAQERLRLSRDLHDSVNQSLYSVTLFAGAAEDSLAAGAAEDARAHLGELREAMRDAMREMRLLVFELHSPALEPGGLAGALRARLEAVEARGGIRAELQVDGTGDLTRVMEEELFGIAREALNNALAHAHSRTVRVHLLFSNTGVNLEVADDGVGFDATRGRSPGTFGISGMEERARRIGATLSVQSAPGRGTMVAVCLPLARSAPPLGAEARHG